MQRRKAERLDRSVRTEHLGKGNEELGTQGKPCEVASVLCPTPLGKGRTGPGRCHLSQWFRQPASDSLGHAAIPEQHLSCQEVLGPSVNFAGFDTPARLSQSSGRMVRQSQPASAEVRPATGAFMRKLLEFT